MGDARGIEDENGNVNKRVEKRKIMEYGAKGGCMVYCFLPLSSSVDNGVFLKHIVNLVEKIHSTAFYNQKFSLSHFFFFFLSSSCRKRIEKKKKNPHPPPKARPDQTHTPCKI